MQRVYETSRTALLNLENESTEKRNLSESSPLARSDSRMWQAHFTIVWDMSCIKYNGYHGLIDPAALRHIDYPSGVLGGRLFAGDCLGTVVTRPDRLLFPLNRVRMFRRLLV